MLPQAFRIEPQAPGAAPVLAKLMEHYIYDMSEWFGFDSDSDGAYHYDAQRCWEGDGAVYFAFAGQIPIGFALVTAAQWPQAPAARDLKEFFVMRRHRHSGVGERLATAVWNRHRGPWLVRVYAGNRPAVPFWRRVLAAYTGGAHRENQVHTEGRDWLYFTFDSPGMEHT